MSKTYASHFYEEMQDTSLSSALVIVPYVIDLVSPRSVLDVGCGEGIWLSVFQSLGVLDILGLDGDWVDRARLKIPPERFAEKNLLQPLEIDRSFDLTMSLEVAEHLPSAHADQFVAELVKRSHIVLFSAAIPYQGGVHHVNEQWPDYWENKFAAYGYVPIDCMRRHFWRDKKVSFFYSQNVFLYVNESRLIDYPKLLVLRNQGMDAALSVVHPEQYLYYAKRWRMLVPYFGKLPPFVLHAVKKLLSFFQSK